MARMLLRSTLAAHREALEGLKALSGIGSLAELADGEAAIPLLSSSVLRSCIPSRMPTQDCIPARAAQLARLCSEGSLQGTFRIAMTVYTSLVSEPEIVSDYGTLRQKGPLHRSLRRPHFEAQSCNKSNFIGKHLWAADIGTSELSSWSARTAFGHSHVARQSPLHETCDESLK